MAKRGYKVCWWHAGDLVHTTCRTLSAAQHRSAKEAAETVLMQNPRALVQVIPPGSAHGGRVFHRGARGGAVEVRKRRSRR